MKMKGYVFSKGVIMLMIANTMLDYNAICEYFDTEPFKLDQLGVGNLLGIVIAFGVALALSIAAQKAATCKVQGQNRQCVEWLAGCSASCIIVAAFRLSYEAASAGRSISGGVLASLNVADVFFAGMMLMMLAIEAYASYSDRLSEYEREATALIAAIERIESDLANIDEQVITAAKIVNSRIQETLCAVNAANEAVYESALNRAGELQSSFVGYVSEGKKAREAHDEEIQERLEKMLIHIPDSIAEPTEAPGKPSRKQSIGYQRRDAAVDTAAIVAA